MNECRYHGKCHIEFDGHFDVCCPCLGDGIETCMDYESMPDTKALLALADEMYGRLDEYDVGLHGGIYMANEMRKYARRIREACGVSE